MKKCRVVNLYKEDYDVYIGRGRDPKTGKWGTWGNPFRLGDICNGKPLDRNTCLDAYAEWLAGSAEGMLLQKRLPELRGKRLGCFCKPKKCHGDLLAWLVNEMDDEKSSGTLFSLFRG